MSVSVFDFAAKFRNIQFDHQLVQSRDSWDTKVNKIHQLQARSSAGVSERQSGMDFQSAMETFAEAWVAATAGAQVLAIDLLNTS